MDDECKAEYGVEDNDPAVGGGGAALAFAFRRRIAPDLSIETQWEQGLELLSEALSGFTVEGGVWRGLRLGVGGGWLCGRGGFGWFDGRDGRGGLDWLSWLGCLGGLAGDVGGAGVWNRLGLLRWSGLIMIERLGWLVGLRWLERLCGCLLTPLGGRLCLGGT